MRVSVKGRMCVNVYLCIAGTPVSVTAPEMFSTCYKCTNKSIEQIRVVSIFYIQDVMGN